MTWQRIDQNTYIDDTLVTCAEYQLFIDEMRDQGKYYQPDHWTSYNYLDGQAKAPILGVRHLDAVEFCEWLTSKEVEANYQFRLPTQTEAEFSSLKIFTNGPIGYWLSQNQEFDWHNEFSDFGKWGIMRHWEKEKQISEEIVIARPLAFSEYHYLTLDLTFDPVVENLAPLFFNRIVDLLGWIREDKMLDSKRRVFIAMFLTKFKRNEILNNVIYHLLEHASSHDKYLDLGIALMTIRERIAGRSPAFEGIRLVKERIK